MHMMYAPSSSPEPSKLMDNCHRYMSSMIFWQMSTMGLCVMGCVKIWLQVMLARSMKKCNNFSALSDSKCVINSTSQAPSTLIEKSNRRGCTVVTSIMLPIEGLPPLLGSVHAPLLGPVHAPSLGPVHAPLLWPVPVTCPSHLPTNHSLTAQHWSGGGHLCPLIGSGHHSYHSWTLQSLYQWTASSVVCPWSADVSESAWCRRNKSKYLSHCFSTSAAVTWHCELLNFNPCTWVYICNDMMLQPKRLVFRVV